MTDILIQWGLVSGLFMAAAAAVPSIKVKGWGAAVGSALVLGIANVLLGFPLKFVAKMVLFLPNLFTFGLVGVLISLVVNVFLLRATDKAVGDDMSIQGVPTLVGLSLAISLLTNLV